MDVLLYIGRIVLIAAGCAALIYLSIVFKNLAETLKAATRTLDVVQRDLEKLESPLQTVDDISNTVDELHVSAKKAADSALSTFTAGMDNLKNKFDAKKDAAPETVDAIVVEEPAADFQPIADVKQTPKSSADEHPSEGAGTEPKKGEPEHE